MQQSMRENLREQPAQRASQAQPRAKGGDLAASLADSPMMVAQRKQLDRLFGPAIQRVEDEEPLQGKFDTVQRMEDEEPLQGRFETAQRAEEEDPLQGKFGAALSVQRQEESAKPNRTGLPDNLKSGIESLSGLSMDNVRVHYNSSQPAQLNAHAYTQGADIHVAPGQERHLPHEAWHVVQQAQGRVQPTMQMKSGVPINDDHSLEHEADAMGVQALQQKNKNKNSFMVKPSDQGVVQRVIEFTGPQESVYLPHLIDEHSLRSPYFARAVMDPNIVLTVNLKTGVATDPRQRRLNGETRIFMKCGDRHYYLGRGAKPETLLRAAIENGDYLKMTKLFVNVDVYRNPEEGVEKSMEAMMAVFAHEWELHVQPALQLYVLIKLKMQNKGDNDEIGREIREHTDLIMGGEEAEHADKTARFSLIATLLKGIDAIPEGEGKTSMMYGFLEQMINLEVTAQELREYEPELEKEGVTAKSWAKVIERREVRT